jgi:hypothetical protein
MASNLQITHGDGINLIHVSHIAEEFYGKVTKRNDNGILLLFSNSSHCELFKKTIQPYFSGKCLI